MCIYITLFQTLVCRESCSFEEISENPNFGLWSCAKPVKKSSEYGKEVSSPSVMQCEHWSVPVISDVPGETDVRTASSMSKCSLVERTV